MIEHNRAYRLSEIDELLDDKSEGNSAGNSADNSIDVSIGLYKIKGEIFMDGDNPVIYINPVDAVRASAEFLAYIEKKMDGEE